MVCWPTTWKHMPTSASTRAKLVFGTVAATNQPTPQALGPRHGQATGNSLPPNKVSPCWGPPIGTEQYVQQFLRHTLANHKPLLDQLPQIADLQAAWLLLLYTASPRSNYLLRLLPPAQTRGFAADHDLEVTRCLTQLLQTNQLPVDAACHWPWEA